VARRDDDPRGRAELLHGEGAERRRRPVDEEVRPDPEAGEDGGGVEGEDVAPAPRVAGDDDAAAGGVGDGGEEMAGDARRGAADDRAVHPVRPGAEEAAQARRAELQLGAEAVGEGVFVARREELVELADGLGVGVGRAPGADGFGKGRVHPADGSARRPGLPAGTPLA